MINDILHKKTSDLTVSELLDLNEILTLQKYPTMDLATFCKVIGKSSEFVYSRIKNRLYPESMIVGGYNYRAIRKTKSPLFFTAEVIKYLKG